MRPCYLHRNWGAEWLITRSWSPSTKTRVDVFPLPFETGGARNASKMTPSRAELAASAASFSRPEDEPVSAKWAMPFDAATPVSNKWNPFEWDLPRIINKVFLELCSREGEDEERRCSLSLSQRYALLFLGYQSLQLKCTTSQPACQTENFKKEVWIARSLPNVLELYCKFFSLQYIPTDTLGKIKNAYNIHSHLLKSSRFGKSLICFG